MKMKADETRKEGCGTDPATAYETDAATASVTGCGKYSRDSLACQVPRARLRKMAHTQGLPVQ